MGKFMQCDVLIIGSGPAGSAAAIVLGRAGRRVLLVDRHEFPRDKVCGDALIPDAHRAIDQLGLGQAMRSPRAFTTTSMTLVAPNGTDVHLQATLATDREHVTPWIWRNPDVPSLLPTDSRLKGISRAHFAHTHFAAREN